MYINENKEQQKLVASTDQNEIHLDEKIAGGRAYSLKNLGPFFSRICKCVSTVFKKIARFFYLKSSNKSLKNLKKISNDISKNEGKQIEDCGLKNKEDFWSENHQTFDAKVLEPPLSKNQKKRLEGFAEALAVVQEKLTEAGIPCWIDAGTLLGIYRYGGKQMPQDYDADLCILQRDAYRAAQILKQISCQHPFKYYLHDLSQADPGRYLRMWTPKTGGWVGIESFVVNSDKKEMSMVYQADAISNVFPLQKTRFYGKDVWIPAKPKEHLENRYRNLDPISFWNEEKKCFIVDITHPSAESEIEKIKAGKVKGKFHIPQNEAELNSLRK